MINFFRKVLSYVSKPGSLKRQVSLVMTQSGIEAVTMTVASLLVVRWFGPDLLGQLAILLAGVQLVTNICDGHALALVRFVSRNYLKDIQFGKVTGWRLAWITTGIHSGLSILIGLIGWFLLGAHTDLILIILAVFVATFRAGRTIFESALRSVRNFGTPAYAAVVCTTLMAVLIISFSVSGYGVAGYLTVMAVMTACNMTWIVWDFHRRMAVQDSSPVPEPEPKTAEYLAYAFPLAMRGLSGFFFLKINIWLIGWLATVGDAGQFRLVDQFLTIPALVFSAVLTAVAPRIAELREQGSESLSNFFAQLYGLMFILSVPVALFFFFNGHVLTLAFPGFETASRMLMFFTPVIILRGIANSASLLLMQSGYPQTAFWLSFLPCIGNLVFSVIGFYLGGVMGLVFGTVLVHLVTYVVTIIVSHRLLELPFRIRFGWSNQSP